MADSDKSISDLIEHWVPDHIRRLAAYHVPSAKGLIKLDAMENPYSLPDPIREGWLEALSNAQINRYPDPNCCELKRIVGELVGLPEQGELVFGNGSDELIQIIAMLLGGSERTFLAPSPSFSMYRQICLATSTQFVSSPLDENFNLNADAFLETIKEVQPACIFLAYPNNPTGNCFDKELIREVIRTAPGLVVVDEAYHAFCGESFIEEVGRAPNLAVLRTFSKSGLAGLRLGFLIASRSWCEQIEKLRLPYNINALTQTCANHVLVHQDILSQQTDEIVQQRELTFERLRTVPASRVFPSKTNFHLMRFEQDANTVFEKLVAKGILVKNLHGSDPALENCLRITVGKEEENTAFFEALQKIQTELT